MSIRSLYDINKLASFTKVATPNPDEDNVSSAVSDDDADDARIGDVKALQMLRNSDTGQKALNTVSSGEILAEGTGAALGGLGGYILANLIHKNPSTLRKTLYALGGAAVGGLGTYGILANVTGDSGLPQLEEFRLRGQANRNPEVQKILDMISDQESWKTNTAKVTGISAGSGFAAGSGLSIATDLRNRRRTMDLYKEYCQRGYTGTLDDFVQAGGNSRLSTPVGDIDFHRLKVEADAAGNLKVKGRASNIQRHLKWGAIGGLATGTLGAAGSWANNAYHEGQQEDAISRFDNQ